MSYNVGVYTAPTGAESAQPGQVVQSAVWNNINTDYATAFNQIGFGRTAVRIVVSFTVTNTDNPITVPFLPGFNSARLEALNISQAGANISASSVQLYVSAGGSNSIIGSTAVTVTSTVSNAANNFQAITGPTTTALQAPTVYVRLSVASANSPGTAVVTAVFQSL